MPGQKTFSKSEPFKIYPDGNMESGPTMQKVVKEVSFFYGKYRNVFEECELFRRRANGHYNFEFLAGARDTTFNYYCNQRRFHKNDGLRELLFCIIPPETFGRMNYIS